MSDQWMQQNRKLLDDILNQLIPANHEKEIPSAGDVGVGDFITTRAAEDQDVLSALKEILSSATAIDGNVSMEMVEQLEKNCTESFSMLVRLTYMGYYSRPDMRSLVGVGSWPVHPSGYEVPVESADLLKKLTDPVTKRGPIYREPDDVQVPSIYAT